MPRGVYCIYYKKKKSTGSQTSCASFVGKMTKPSLLKNICYLTGSPSLFAESNHTFGGQDHSVQNDPGNEGRPGVGSGGGSKIRNMWGDPGMGVEGAVCPET